MKSIVPIFTTSTEDLLKLIVQWKDNPHLTPNQKQLWPGDKIIEYLGYDQPNFLRLLKADGLDDLPILINHKSKEIIETIGNNENLILSGQDVCRLALFFHLEMYQVLILLIKTHWELEIQKETKSLNIKKYKQIDNVEVKLQQFSDSYQYSEKLAGLHELMHLYYNYIEKTNFDREIFQTLVQQIIINRSFFYPIDSNEIKIFIDSQNELMEIIKNENAEYNDFFHSRNKQWLNLIQEAELNHIRLEEIRLKNDAVERKWLIEFGPLYCELLNIEFEHNSLQRQIGFKTSNPSMSREQLVEADKAAIQTELAKIESLKQDISLNQLVAKMDDTKAPEGDTDENLFKEYKKALRSIWLKTHPDKLIDKQFSTEQLEILNQYYREATEMSVGDRILYPRNLLRLNQIIDEIDQIYQNMGLNIPLNSTIQGKSLKEKTEWLEKQISFLESEISSLKNELYSLSIDSTIKQKTDSLKSHEIIESIKKQMNERRDTLIQDIQNLNFQLESLFQ